MSKRSQQEYIRTQGHAPTKCLDAPLRPDQRRNVARGDPACRHKMVAQIRHSGGPVLANPIESRFRIRSPVTFEDIQLGGTDSCVD